MAYDNEHWTHWLSRCICGVCPFGTVRIANQVFDTLPRQALQYQRRLFGSTIQLPINRSMTHQLLYLLGERAVEERTLVKRYLEPGMHAVDVGANVGYYAALIQSVIGSTGHITLIEPSPENLTELNANIHLNSWRNYSLVNCALGADEAIVGLQSGINSGVVPAGDGASTVQMRSLDSVCREINRAVDFIKVDVEGYEWDVLQGARATIKEDRPILFLEVHPLMIGEHGGSIALIVEFIQEFYDRIEFFDLPSGRSILAKTFSHFGLTNTWRKVDIAGIPEERLHLGRKFGTLWIVASKN